MIRFYLEALNNIIQEKQKTNDNKQESDTQLCDVVFTF
jgi:hypothetical protein